MRTLWYFFTIFSLITVSAPRRADGEGLVMTSGVGTPPSGAERVLSPITDELVRRGFLAGAAAQERVNQRFGTHLPVAAPHLLVTASTQVATGYEAYIEGDCKKALPLLDEATETLRRYTADARDRRMRDDYFRGLAVIAACQDREQAAEPAIAAMAELIRTFSERPVTAAEYPPRVTSLYHGVKRSLAKAGYGALEVQCDEPTAAIYVNERFAGTGAAHATELPAGRYRVFTEVGTTRGRLHIVTINPGAVTRIEARWRLESVIGAGAPNLRFDTQKARIRGETQMAVSIAREIGATSVVILSPAEMDGHSAISGVVLDVDTATVQRKGSMALAPIEPPHGKLRLLGRYLAGEKITDPLLATGEVSARRQERERRPFDFRRTAGIAGVVGGVAALGVGAYFGVRTMQLHSDADRECREDWACTPAGQRFEDRAHTHATAANVFVATGLVLGASGLALWLTARPDERIRVTPLSVANGGAGLSLQGRF